MAKVTGALLVISALAGTAVQAQAQVTGDAAAAMLWPEAGGEVEMLADGLLPEDQAKVLRMVARDQPYYAAIAISPDEGLMSEATVAAANHHTVEAASVIALAECNAKKTGTADCVIVALVRPEGWTAQPLQMSQAATQDFASYQGGALALSAATGSWGIGVDDAAATAACAARNPAATDCAVAIRD